MSTYPLLRYPPTIVTAIINQHPESQSKTTPNFSNILSSCVLVTSNTSPASGATWKWVSKSRLGGSVPRTAANSGRKIFSTRDSARVRGVPKIEKNGKTFLELAVKEDAWKKTNKD